MTKIADVFKSLGQPTTTYVERMKGVHERSLLTALNQHGRLCLLTGPSKTGKTTLYTKVLEDMELEPLTVRCDASISTTEFWRKALERVQFERVSQSQLTDSTSVKSSGKVGIKLGWSWLAKFMGEVGLEVGGTESDAEIREKILSKPSPAHLIPILKHLPYVLVVEDFHYLSPGTQKNIFQQFKAFVDAEVSVIVVGTTHHAIDIANANKDLVGRITMIRLSTWNPADLKLIASKGFEHLNIDVSPVVPTTIAKESVGLPIITQDVCYRLLVDRSIHESSDDIIRLSASKKDVYDTLHHVAVQSYSQFQAIYNRLSKGPRRGAQKFKTYELVLATFAQNPMAFSLEFSQITDRLNKMPIDENEKPPPTSVKGMLSVLKKFQKQLDVELLEWMETEQCLYILEPSFLFYIRWREKRAAPPTIREIMKSLFPNRKA